MRRLLWFGLGAVLATGVAVAVWPRHHREVTTHSKVAYEFYRQGQEDYECWERLAAREAYLKAIQADSTFAMAYLGLAQCYSSVGWAADRDAALEKAVRLSKGCTDLECLLIAQGKADMQGDRKGADSALNDLIKKYPENPRTLILQATRAWRYEGKLDEAAELLQKALALDPTQVTIHNLLGYVEMDRGNTEAAIASLERYAYYAPNQPNPHDSLGEIYYKAGRYEDAIAQYLEALRIQPEFHNSAAMLADVLATTGQFKQAHLVLDTAKQVFVEYKQERQWELGQISIDLDARRFEDVLASTQKFLPFHDDLDMSTIGLEAGVHRARAYCQMELKQYAEAAASLDALDNYWQRLREAKPGLFKGPDDAKIMLSSKLLHARLAALRGQTTAAASIAHAAFADSKLPDKDLVPYWAGVASTCFEIGDYQSAIDLAHKVIARVPTNPTANRALGMSLAKTGDNDGAISALSNYLHVMRAADPGNSEVDSAKAAYDRVLAAS